MSKFGFNIHKFLGTCGFLVLASATVNAAPTQPDVTQEGNAIRLSWSGTVGNYVAIDKAFDCDAGTCYQNIYWGNPKSTHLDTDVATGINYQYKVYDSSGHMEYSPPQMLSTAQCPAPDIDDAIADFSAGGSNCYYKMQKALGGQLANTSTGAECEGTGNNIGTCILQSDTAYIVDRWVNSPWGNGGAQISIDATPRSEIDLEGPADDGLHTYIFPNDGWYQLQTVDTFEELCSTGGSDCNVAAGAYRLINHTPTPTVRTIITIPDDIGDEPGEGGDGETAVARNINDARFESHANHSYLTSGSPIHNNLTVGDAQELVVDLGIGTNDFPNEDFDFWPYDDGNASDNGGQVGDGNFRVGCQWSHYNYDDPIVNGVQNDHHLHLYWGNTNADYRTTTKNDLVSRGGGTCNGYELNRSAYWMPALMNGESQAIVPHEIIVYYKTKTVCRNRIANREPVQKADGSTAAACTVDRNNAEQAISNPGTSHTAEQVEEMPQGLQLISGNKVGVDLNAIADANPTLTNGSTQDISEFVFWSCGVNGSVNTRFPRIPTQDQFDDLCPDIEEVRDDGTTITKKALLNATVYFPQCWKGPGHLESPDPFVWEHVRQVTTEDACPASHPKRLPQLGYLVYWDVDNINNDNLYLSSDALDGAGRVANGNPGGTLHADWFAGWQEKVMDTWIDECLKENRNCTFGQTSTQFRLKNDDHKYRGHATSEDARRLNSSIGSYAVGVNGSMSMEMNMAGE